MISYLRAQNFSYMELGAVSVQATMVFVAGIYLLGFTTYRLVKGAEFPSVDVLAGVNLFLTLGTVAHFSLLSISRFARARTLSAAGEPHR